MYNVNPFELIISEPFVELDGEGICKVIGFEIETGEQLVLFRGTYGECRNFVSAIEATALAQLRHYHKLMDKFVAIDREVDYLKEELREQEEAYDHLLADYDAERASHAIHGEEFRKLERAYEDAEKSSVHWYEQYKIYHKAYKSLLEKHIGLDHKYQAEVARREELQKKHDELHHDFADVAFELKDLKDTKPEVPKDIILKMVQSGLKCEAIRLVWQSFGYEFNEARQIVHRIMAEG